MHPVGFFLSNCDIIVLESILREIINLRGTPDSPGTRRGQNPESKISNYMTLYWEKVCKLSWVQANTAPMDVVQQNIYCKGSQTLKTSGEWYQRHWKVILQRKFFLSSIIKAKMTQVVNSVLWMKLLLSCFPPPPQKEKNKTKPLRIPLPRAQSGISWLWCSLCYAGSHLLPPQDWTEERKASAAGAICMVFSSAPSKASLGHYLLRWHLEIFKDISTKMFSRLPY